MAFLSTTTLGDEWLGYNGATTNAALLANAISYAEGEIVRYLNQPVLAETKTFSFRGNGTARVILPYLTCVTLTTLTERSDVTDSYVAVDGTPVVYEEGLLFYLHADGVFAKGTQYKATLSAGWATISDIPDDIIISGYELAKEVVLQTVKGAIGPDRFGLSAISEGEGGISISKAIVSQTDRMRKRLSKYRWLSI